MVGVNEDPGERPDSDRDANPGGRFDGGDAGGPPEDDNEPAPPEDDNNDDRFEKPDRTPPSARQNEARIDDQQPSEDPGIESETDRAQEDFPKPDTRGPSERDRQERVAEQRAGIEESDIQDTEVVETDEGRRIEAELTDDAKEERARERFEDRREAVRSEADVDRVRQIDQYKITELDFEATDEGVRVSRSDPPTRPPARPEASPEEFVGGVDRSRTADISGDGPIASASPAGTDATVGGTLDAGAERFEERITDPAGAAGRAQAGQLGERFARAGAGAFNAPAAGAGIVRVTDFAAEQTTAGPAGMVIIEDPSDAQPAVEATGEAIEAGAEFAAENPAQAGATGTGALVGGFAAGGATRLGTRALGRGARLRPTSGATRTATDAADVDDVTVTQRFISDERGQLGAGRGRTRQPDPDPEPEPIDPEDINPRPDEPDQTSIRPEFERGDDIDPAGPLQRRRDRAQRSSFDRGESEINARSARSAAEELGDEATDGPLTRFRQAGRPSTGVGIGAGTNSLLGLGSDQATDTTQAFDQSQRGQQRDGLGFDVGNQPIRSTDQPQRGGTTSTQRTAQQATGQQTQTINQRLTTTATTTGTPTRPLVTETPPPRRLPTPRPPDFPPAESPDLFASGSEVVDTDFVNPIAESDEVLGFGGGDFDLNPEGQGGLFGPPDGGDGGGLFDGLFGSSGGN